MAGPAEGIDDVPLGEALPGHDTTTLEALRLRLRELESHQRAAGRCEWWWFPSAPAPGPAGTALSYSLLTLTIALARDHADWLELSLDLGRSEPEGLLLTASVEVACWCPRDHNMHAVRHLSFPATTSRLLIDGVLAGAALLEDVLTSGPWDADSWRAIARLPPRPA